MEDHVVIFIDFLGTREAVSSWAEEKLAEFVSLLHNLSALQGEFSLLESSSENGKTVNVKPTITTFSDHIVISFPISSLAIVNASDPHGMALLLTNKLVGALAAEAIQLGLLIRGGATAGPLYHKKGVVLGKAMAEAYDLESRVAQYPRIAVSRKLYSKIITKGAIPIAVDDDGIRHFSYFRTMLWSGGGESGDQFFERLRHRSATIFRNIDENIAKFEASEDWNRLSKWTWLKMRMLATKAQFPEHVFHTP